MSFQFNWAGLSVPAVNMGQEVDMNKVGENLGRGLRGYRDRQAANEYARKIDAYRNSQLAYRGADMSEIDSIQAEIARLENENAQIDLALGQGGGNGYNAAVDNTVRNAMADQMNDGDEELQKFMSFDPQKAMYTNKNIPYTKDEIKAIQRYIGMPENKVDGLWGNESMGYYNTFTNI